MHPKYIYKYHFSILCHNAKEQDLNGHIFQSMPSGLAYKHVIYKISDIIWIFQFQCIKRDRLYWKGQPIIYIPLHMKRKRQSLWNNGFFLVCVKDSCKDMNKSSTKCWQCWAESSELWHLRIQTSTLSFVALPLETSWRKFPSSLWSKIIFGTWREKPEGQACEQGTNKYWNSGERRGIPCLRRISSYY